MLTVALHDAQELDNDLGGGSDKDLALAPALGIDDVVEAVVLQKMIREERRRDRAHLQGRRCGPW